MKRVVVDTHVLLASLLGGEARLVMRYWWEGEVALVLSEEMVEEYLAALARLGDTREGARELVEAFGKRGKAVWVGAGREEGGGAPALRTSRPEDGAPTGGVFPKRPALNKFVECAVAGKAEAIIAGDPDLVERGGYKGIPILTPGEWLEGRFERRE